MNIGAWNYYESLNKDNYLFLNKDAGIGDDLLLPFNELYSHGKKIGVNFMTLDVIENFGNMDGFIFFDFPNLKNSYVKKVFRLDTPKYLIIFEPENIKPDNWLLENHELFNKIFTWNDEIIDNKKYFKINFSYLFPQSINKALLKQKKLCTLIAGNSRNNHPLELYSKRVEAIRWFEESHPEEFDFYGVGWNEHTSSNKYIKFLLRKLKLSKIMAPYFPCYRGKIESKKEVLNKYKFSICYENVRDMPGYISEKIFDCFFSGCVPIYWGANNIGKHIPGTCYIDKRDFDTYEELYEFISNMENDKYMEYLKGIQNYLKSKKSHEFNIQYFVEAIVSNIKY
jgi:alpha(1,3/1,4) fucosyltransferase